MLKFPKFPNTSLWLDCLLRVAFKSPRVEALWVVPIRLLRCIVGATCGIQLWIGGKGVFRKFVGRALLEGFEYICTFHRSTCRSLHLHRNFCDIRVYHGKALLWAHLCRRRFALSLPQANSCGNHLYLKRRGYVLRYHFSLWNNVNDTFGPFSATYTH